MESVILNRVIYSVLLQSFLIESFRLLLRAKNKRLNISPGALPMLDILEIPHDDARLFYVLI